MGAYEEILKIKELHDSGIVTDDEFKKLKNNIISKETPDTEIKEIANISESVTLKKEYSKSECASCQRKLGAMSRLKLKDGAYICLKCLRSSSQHAKKMSASDVNALLKTLTLETLNDENIATSALSENKRLLDEKKRSKGLKCPKCGSPEIQFMQQNKKAFSIGKAAAGTLLTGGIGSLVGFTGKKGKKEWFCQSCNNVFYKK